MNFEIKKISTAAFSLVETMAAMIIAAMILMVSISIYQGLGQTAEAVSNKIETQGLPAEIMQRIAEDLDRMATAGADVSVIFETKFNSGFYITRLTISTRIFNKDPAPQAFETVVWQTDYDIQTNRLTLYRSRTGISPEDRLLEEKKTRYERELFVPVCTGISFFRIQALQGDVLMDNWVTESTLPRAIVITISFAEPYKTLTGELDVSDFQKTVRTVAIDRTKKMQFDIVLAADVNDPNSVTDANTVTDIDNVSDVNDRAIE